jgi:hypothetical protein
MMPLPDEPTDLSPEQRCREIAALLARGVLRLLDTRQIAPESAPSESAAEAPEPLHKDLEMSETSSVDGTTGSRK